MNILLILIIFAISFVKIFILFLIYGTTKDVVIPWVKKWYKDTFYDN